jgi:hypothetical protein
MPDEKKPWEIYASESQEQKPWEKFQPVKKKETTVSPSVQKPKPISSGTPSKETQKPLGTSVSKNKVEVFTNFPTKEDNQYRIINNNWQRKEPGKDWVTVKDSNAIIGLNKQYKKNIVPSEGFEGISGKLIDNEEEKVVPYLQKNYGRLGFNFEQTGVGDRIRVITQDGKNSEVFMLDNWTDEGDSSEAVRLKAWLKENINTIDRERYNKIDDEISAIKNITPKQRESLKSDAFSNMSAEIPDELALDIKTQLKLKEKEKEAMKYNKSRMDALMTDINKAKQTKGKEDDAEVRARVAAVYGNKDEIAKQNRYISNSLNDIARVSVDLNRKSKEYDDEVVRWQADLERNNGIETPELTERKLALEGRAEMLNKETSSLDQNLQLSKSYQTKLDDIAGEYMLFKEGKGSTGGAMINNFLKGATNIWRFAGLERSSQEELIKLIGSDYTTQEFATSKERSDIEKVLFSLSNSIGAAVGGGGVATLPSFYAQTYYDVKDEMDDNPDFNGVPELEKTLVASTIGLTVGWLEKFGLEKIMSKNPISKSIINKVLLKTVGDLPKDATAEMLEQAINTNVKALLAKGAINVAGGALVEGSTEFAQELAEGSIKKIYNAMKGKKMFEEPESLLAQSFEAAYLGAMGGAIMQSPVQATKAITDGISNKNKLAIEILEKSVTDSELRSMMVTKIKTKIVNGELTKEEGQKQIDAVNETANTFEKLPDNITDENRNKSFDLLIERSKIEKEIAGKDENLVAVQKARIADINNELKNISENAVKESTKPVEEVTAEGGGLQREGVNEGQPQVREGERPVGETTQQGTDLGNRPVEGRGVQEEGVETIDVYHGGSMDEKTGDIYVTEDKNQATEYAKGNQGNVIKYTIPKNAVASEQDVTNAISELGVEVNDESRLYELIDPRFEETYIGDDNKQKLFDSLKNKGFEAASFIDEDLSLNEKQGVKNIVVFEAEKLSPSSITVKENEAENLYDQGYRPVIDGQIQVDYNKENIGDLFEKSDRAEMSLPTEPTAVAEEVTTEEAVAPEVQAEVEALGKLLEGTDEQIDEQFKGIKISKDNKKVAESIVNAAKSISKILPSVKFVVHDNDKSYRKATNEEGRSQSSAGEYNPKTKTIHINASKANNRTAAHEVFHAVILNGINTDLEAQRLTKAMIDAVRKSLVNVEGAGQVISYLNDFASNYEENIQNEEKLAELFAILADNYVTLPTTTQNLIRRFLDRIAKIFGLKPLTDREVIDFMNTVSQKVAKGEEITSNDIKAIAEGSSTFISIPSIINKLSRKQEAVAIDKKFDLSFVTEKDLVDIESLINEISNKNQKVWFWVADQLGRGMYFDNVIGKEHYLDAGPSYALDPKNRDKSIIWASGKSAKELNRFINSSDYIFIISGSPTASKFFNVSVFELLQERVGDFNSFKKDVLESNPIKAVREVMESHDSWDSIKQSPDRKKLLNAFEDVKTKKGTRLKEVLENYNAFIDPNELRDGFYKENNFKMNDIMLVLKPKSVGGKSQHSTYENDLLGEVIGVPNKKVNAFDIMPKEIKDKYSNITAEAQKSQVVAPYGAGVKSISAIDNSFEARKQTPQGMTQIISTARQNGFSDAAITQYLLNQGYTQQQITNAMSAGVAGSMSIDEIFNKSKEALNKKKKGNIVVRALRFIRQKFLDRQAAAKRIIKGISGVDARRAYNLLINKAGAKGLAAFRFKEAEGKIYKGLNKKQLDALDKIIYARRVISVNENRKANGMNPYRGMGGYSEVNAQNDLAKIRSEIGDATFDKLNSRADAYFDVFRENLDKLYESGRIVKETYESLRDLEYSPIKTLKYLISEDTDIGDIDKEAARLGVSKKDIMKLTDQNENEIITDSRWLLMMNIETVESRAFENKMLREFAKAVENSTAEEKIALSEFMITDNPIIGSYKDGRPKRKYDDEKLPLGYRKINYYKNGVQQYIIVKESFANQLLDIKNKNKGFELIGKLTGGQILRFFATGGNPLFIIGNTAVDFQNILLFSDVYSKGLGKFKVLGGLRLGWDFTKNFFRKAIQKDTLNKTYREYVEHGGAMDYMSNDGIRAIKELNPGFKIFSPIHKLILGYGKAMAFLGETSEVAFRLSVYDKVKNDLISDYKKENGTEPTGQDLEDIMYEATREARETIDFSQGGDWAKQADLVMPYLNASLQGFRRPLDYARKNPVAFASSMIQASLMAGSVAGMSLAALAKAIPGDDEEEKKKKIANTLASLSDYEKANYHIIFTGNVDENGEYTYVRIKKLPLLSVLSTISEQYLYKHLLGDSYKLDDKVINTSIEMSTPLMPSDIMSRNPLVSGLLTYHFNEDTFTGEKVFREPKNKKIDPTSEGIYDNKVEDIYKVLAPKLGLSPIRTKAFVEKIITSENTNPTIAIFNGAANGVFTKDSSFGKEFTEGLGKVFESAERKLVRKTNKDILMYKKQDEAEAKEMLIETEIYNKEQKVYNEIKSIYDKGEKMTNGELIDMVKDNFDKKDVRKYVEKYYAYIRNMNVDKSILDIIYEDTPEVQALKLYNRYGTDLDSEEVSSLNKAMAASGRKVSKNAIVIYNKKYKNR